MCQNDGVVCRGGGWGEKIQQNIIMKRTQKNPTKQTNTTLSVSSPFFLCVSLWFFPAPSYDSFFIRISGICNPHSSDPPISNELSCPKIDRQKWRQNLKIDWKWKWRNLEIYCLILKTEKSKEANDWLILELLRFSIFISSSSFWNFQQHCIFNIKWSISKAMPILKPKKRNGQTTSFIFLNTFLHAVWYVFLLDSIPHS